MRGERAIFLHCGFMVYRAMDQPTLVERTGSALVYRVDRSNRLDAWSVSKPSTLPLTSRSTFSPSKTSRVSAPGPALSST